MARIHPSTPLHAPLTAGDYRERDVLRTLGDGLPADFDVFHNLPSKPMGALTKTKTLATKSVGSTAH